MKNQHAMTKAKCRLGEAGSTMIDPASGLPYLTTNTGLPVSRCDSYLNGGPKYTDEGKMAWP